MLATGFMTAAVAFAQVKEGRVVYERVMQMPNVRSFGNADLPQQQQLPRTRTDNFELLFTSAHSLWQYLPSASSDDGTMSPAPGMMIRMNVGNNDVSYVNFATGQKTDQREAMEKTFIIGDTIGKNNWKITGETKEILNFKAVKATTQTVVNRVRMSMENGEMKREPYADTVSVVAWFTPEIPVPAGPDYQGQLPGLILELITNNGLSTYRAVELSTKVNAAKIREPKGKKITQAEFTRERDKMMEEMRKNMPAGNVIRMN